MKQSAHSGGMECKMKRKLILMTAILAIIGGCFVGCTRDKDDDMTTSQISTSSTEKGTDSDRDNTNMSEGLSSGVSEVSSDIGQGVTNVSEGIDRGVSNVSEGLSDMFE